MKKKGIRMLALLLAIFVLCPVITVLGQLSVSAADESKRFIFSSLAAPSSIAYAANNSQCPALALSALDSVFYAKNLAPMGTGGSTNALYISFDLSEDANVSGVIVEYTYTQNNSAVTRREERSWTDQASERAFVLHTPNLSQGLTALSLRFLCNGTPQGTVTLRSFYDVSVYANDTAQTEGTALATVKKCVYNKDNNTVDITVQLSHEASVYYAEQSLELFALAPDEDPYFSNKTCVARAGVSLNDIHFSVKINGAEELYARYVIAAVNKEGMREPLCDPIYPDIAAENTKLDHGFKGFHTDSFFAVIDSGADVEIVDVYLDRLQSTQGILYAGSRSYYHFDEAYVNELDRRVRNLTGVGCSVYLRFLISPDANDFSFVEGAAGNIVHKGIVIDNEQALLDIHAYTDFLTSRYASAAQGKITGIIIGRQADRASTYGYVGAMGLAEYAELYATALNLIGGAGRVHIPNLQMVVPVSDRMWPETITASNLNGDYLSELFLISLLEVLKAQTLKPPEFTVMLETSALPDAMQKKSADKDDYYGVDDIDIFLSLIEEYSRYYDFMDEKILCSWTPDASLNNEELCTAYALQFVALIMNARVRSFFVDFSLLEQNKKEDFSNGLIYLCTYIDTDQCDKVTAPILRVLGITSFHQLFPNFNSDILKNAKILRVSLQKDGYADGKKPVGSYDLWNFSGATGLLNWYAGNACGDLSVLNRALTARFLAVKNQEFADIAYSFAEIKNFSKAPLMHFHLGLEGDSGTPYEVQIRLFGDRETVISSTVMTGGEKLDLYLDLTDYAADLSTISSIRILSRPLNGTASPYSLQLYRVTLESTELSNEELADLMSDSAGDDEENQSGEKSDYTTPILVTVLVLIISVAVAAIIIMRYRNRKPAQKTTRTENTNDKNKDSEREKK